MLGPLGDIELLDLTDLDPDRPDPGHVLGVSVFTAGGVEAAVAAGVSLLHVQPGLAREPAVAAAAASGTAVVVAGQPEEARRAGRDLSARLTELASRGPGAVGSVVIEVPVGSSVPPITAEWVAEVMNDGLLVGAAMSVDTAGAEIGLLTQVLSAGVCLVRGADPARFRRVRTVVEALSRAGSTTDKGVRP